MFVPLQLPGSGLTESVAQIAVVAGMVVLMLMLVGLGGFAYKNLRGDGVRWPDEREESGEGAQRGSDDDEWKYY
jgi:hypothetical protein